MSKRVFIIFLSVVFLLFTCSTALAITGTDCYENDYEYCETSVATFLLDNSGRIVGVLRPEEELKKVGYQHTTHKSPTNIENGKATRRRVFAKVTLDDNYEVIKGGTDLEVTITLTNYDLVAEVIGYDFTNNDIIDATIYSPCLKGCGTYASHMFLPQGSGRVRVGTVKFKSGKCLALYVGNFDGDCDLELGFTAEPVKEEPVCEPPCHPCPPCTPPCHHHPQCGTPCTQPVTVTTTTVTEVTTVTTTTTTVGGYGCNR